MDLLWPFSCITHVAFGVFPHSVGQYSFYFPFKKKQVVFPDKFLPIKKWLEKSYSHRQIELCFANLFDALVLLRLHFIISITLFQTTYLQEHKQRIEYKKCLSHGKLVGMTEQNDSSIVF